MSRTPGRRKSSGNVGEEALEEIREEESPARSLRKRKAVDPPEETSSRSRRNSSVNISRLCTKPSP